MCWAWLPRCYRRSPDRASSGETASRESLRCGSVVSHSAKGPTRPRRKFAVSSNTGQQVGVGVEDIGGCILGDDVLKGLALGDRLLKVGRTSKLIEESP